MSTLNKRLAQLEKAVRDTGGARCTLCHGYPVAMIFVTHEPDPNGPGFRKTGQRFLAEGDHDRITDDLRCRACGRETAVAHIMWTSGVSERLPGTLLQEGAPLRSPVANGHDC